MWQSIISWWINQNNLSQGLLNLLLIQVYTHTLYVLAINTDIVKTQFEWPNGGIKGHPHGLGWLRITKEINHKRKENRRNLVDLARSYIIRRLRNSAWELQDLDCLHFIMRGNRFENIHVTFWSWISSESTPLNTNELLRFTNGA